MEYCQSFGDHCYSSPILWHSVGDGWPIELLCSWLVLFFSEKENSSSILLSFLGVWIKLNITLICPFNVYKS